MRIVINSKEHYFWQTVLPARSYFVGAIWEVALCPTVPNYGTISDDLCLCGDFQNRWRADFPSQCGFFSHPLVGTDLCTRSFTPTKPVRFVMKAYVVPDPNLLVVPFIYSYFPIHSSFEDGMIFLLSMLILYFDEDTTGVNKMITKQVLIHSTASLPKGTTALSTTHAKLERSKYVGRTP